jgi:hypothetical protein
MRRITLEALNLSPKERAILYVLQTSTMPEKISTISLKAKLPHATSTFVLKRLEKRKLAERIPVNGHFRWKYRKNINIIENLGPESVKDTFLHVSSGMEYLNKEFMKILEIDGGDRLYTIQGSGISKTILNKIDDEFIFEFHQEVRRQDLIIEGVIAESVLTLFEKMTVPQLDSHLNRLTVVYVLPDELIHFPFDIFLFADTILLVDYENERLVRIEDAAFTQVFKSLFNLAQQYGTKINLNQHIEKLIAKKTEL